MFSLSARTRPPSLHCDCPRKHVEELPLTTSRAKAPTGPWQLADSPLKCRRTMVVRGGGRGYHFGGPLFANLSPRLSLFRDHLRTVLAVKGSLRHAQQRRALDGSGPF